MDQDHTDHSIFKISKNTDNGPGDLRRLAETPTSMKDHQAMVEWKIQNWKNNNNNNNKSGSFKGDVLSPLQFAIAMKPLIHLLWK